MDAASNMQGELYANTFEFSNLFSFEAIYHSWMQALQWNKYYEEICMPVNFQKI